MSLSAVLIRLLPHHNNVRTTTVVVVVVHTHHSILKNDRTRTVSAHTTSKFTVQMITTSEKFEKKFWKKNFFSNFFSIFFEVVIIWTVHLDVRKLCGCGHFWGYCGVCGQQPQQQLLSAHCFGAVPIQYMKKSIQIKSWLEVFSKFFRRDG